MQRNIVITRAGAILAAGAACLIGFSGLTTTHANPPAAVSFFAAGHTVAGTVKAADGKPAVGISVRIAKIAPSDSGPAKRDPNNPTGDSSIGQPDATQLQKGPGTGATIATQKTDAAGKFSFPNIQPGEYTVIAGDAQAAGRGSVTVGKDSDPAPIEIKLIKATR
jgi:hypothetical protein